MTASSRKQYHKYVCRNFMPALNDNFNQYNRWLIFSLTYLILLFRALIYPTWGRINPPVRVKMKQNYNIEINRKLGREI